MPVELGVITVGTWLLSPTHHAIREVRRISARGRVVWVAMDCETGLPYTSGECTIGTLANWAERIASRDDLKIVKDAQKKDGLVRPSIREIYQLERRTQRAEARMRSLEQEWEWHLERLDRIKYALVNMIVDPLHTTAWHAFQCPTREAVFDFLGEFEREVVAYAEEHAPPSSYESPRLPCPLCGRTQTMDDRGYAIPVGLRRHLRECQVLEAVRDIGLDHVAAQRRATV